MEIGFDLAVISYQRITISNLMPTNRTNSVMKQKITAVKKNLTKGWIHICSNNNNSEASYFFDQNSDEISVGNIEELECCYYVNFLGGIGSMHNR